MLRHEISKQFPPERTGAHPFLGSDGLIVKFGNFPNLQIGANAVTPRQLLFQVGCNSVVWHNHPVTLQNITIGMLKHITIDFVNQDFKFIGSMKM